MHGKDGGKISWKSNHGPDQTKTRILAFTLQEMGTDWRILSRGMVWSVFHFRRITPAAMCSHGNRERWDRMGETSWRTLKIGWPVVVKSSSVSKFLGEVFFVLLLLYFVLIQISKLSRGWETPGLKYQLSPTQKAVGPLGKLIHLLPKDQHHLKKN